MTPRRESILREMGLAPLWRLRSAGACETEAGIAEAPEEHPREVAAQVPADTAPVAPVAPTPTAPPAVPVTAPRHEPAADRPLPMTPRPSADAGRVVRIAQMEWETLEADIRACTECELCRRRKQAVPGVGDRNADWMLVGEGPGAEEDLRGEPFVGAAGKLLDAMLASIGLERGKGVYIANAVKCRPPHNRTPEADEIAACFPYLQRQIELVQPRILIALGRPAAQAILKSEVSIAASRGRVFHYGSTPVVVTYHPAYLLRNQPDKAKAWEDLCFARRLLA